MTQFVFKKITGNFSRIKNFQSIQILKVKFFMIHQEGLLVFFFSISDMIINRHLDEIKNQGIFLIMIEIINYYFESIDEVIFEKDPKKSENQVINIWFRDKTYHKFDDIPFELIDITYLN